MKEGLSMAEFQPAEAQLQELATKADNVDKGDMAAVHDTRIELRDARIALTKKGKELREGATQFAKAVIAKEKDLLSIIEPKEAALMAIEEEAKQRAEMERRRVELPTRRAALDSIGLDIPVDDDTLLKMDDTVFNEFRLSRIERKLVADKEAHGAKIKADEDAIRARNAEIQRIDREKLEAEKAEFEAKKKADEDRIRKENDAANEAKRIEEAKMAAEKAEIAREKARLEGIEEERQRKIKAEMEEEALKAEKEAAKQKADADAEAKRAEDEKFQAWLKQVGYDPKTDMIGRDQEGNTTVWRVVGTYYENN